MNVSIIKNIINPNHSSFSNDRKIGSRQATIFFIAFGNLPKVTVNSNKARASLREIPEDASVRKPPLKRRSAAATDTNARE